MSSVGQDLEKWINRGLLRIHATRPTATGLESHLATVYNEIQEFKPTVVIIDPITNLVAVGDLHSVKAMLTRLIDFLKLKHITAMFTNLVFGSGIMEETAVGISSLMDTWVVLGDVAQGEAERMRTLNLLKSRGMSHDTRMHRFTLNDKGIEIHGNK
jgi:circadian clock protein KaiC